MENVLMKWKSIARGSVKMILDWMMKLQPGCEKQTVEQT
jgi:hypothetical protein